MHFMRLLSIVALALLMMGAGVMHFVAPEAYTRIVPPFLPWPRAIVFVSGAVEFAAGAGLLWQPTRSLAAWTIMALLVAVFPANLYMAAANIQSEGFQVRPGRRGVACRCSRSSCTGRGRSVAGDGVLPE